MRYIALLRGINVSGHNMIKMDALKKALSDLPFENISTYIQSGNVIFDTSENERSKIAWLIYRKIVDTFGHEVTVFIVTPDELKQAVRENPFADKTPEDSVQPYIGFMSAIPDSGAVGSLKAMDFKKDELRIVSDRIYYWYADSAGNTKLSNAIVEKKLNLRSTARNWKTIKKLIELSGL